LEDIRARKIDVIVVYKVDRLTRSLADFAKLVELFDSHGVSFVSVTQQFNTTTLHGVFRMQPATSSGLKRSIVLLSHKRSFLYLPARSSTRRRMASRLAWLPKL
jgi:hypothetical protein